MTAKELKAEKLAEIVEFVADQECEHRAFTKGGEEDECVNQSPHDDDWCLV